MNLSYLYSIIVTLTKEWGKST